MTIIDKYNKKAVVILKNCKLPLTFKASSPSKISLKENCAFSMLPGPKYGCPGATKACKDCYAMKNRFTFDTVINALGQNWLLYKKFKAKNDTAGLAKALAAIVPKKCEIFRIGESGDFPSQMYINAWANVIKSRPEVKFYTYTRSFRFNYFNILKLQNFSLWASTDNRNGKNATRFVKRYKNYGVKRAYGPWKKRWKMPKNSFHCPTLTGKLAIDGACEKCKLCVIKNRTPKNVVFLKH
jgi:hypothetical protein